MKTILDEASELFKRENGYAPREEMKKDMRDYFLKESDGKLDIGTLPTSSVNMWTSIIVEHCLTAAHRISSYKSMADVIKRPEYLKYVDQENTTGRDGSDYDGDIER